MHDIRYDEVHDEFVVGNPFAQAILTFRGAADGEEPPVRVIQGPSTKLLKPDNLEVDPVNDEIIVPEPETDSIYVYPRLAQGDTAPIRILEGSRHGWNISTVAVDPVNDVLVGVGTHRSGDKREHAIMIFKRDDSGSVAPRAVIKGPRSGLIGSRQIQAYQGWIIVSHPGRGDSERDPNNIFVGVWSIADNGDVAPRWKIGGTSTTLKNPRGVVLNPRAKELIVADMRLNMVLTFSFPELFERSGVSGRSSAKRP